MLNKKQLHELDWKNLKSIKFDAAEEPATAKIVHEIIMKDMLNITITTLNAVIPDPDDSSKTIKTTLVVDFKDGRPVRQIDDNGLETLLSYNDSGAITNIVRSDGHYEVMTYAENGEIATWENSNGSFEKNTYENGVVVRHESSKEGGYWIDFVYGVDGKVAYTFDKKDFENPFMFEVENK